MDPDKIKRLLELSKGLAGGGAWSDMLKEWDAQNVLGRHPLFSDKREAAPTYPPADVLTSMDEVIVLIDLPGVNRKDVQLMIDGDQLTVIGTSTKLFPQGKPYATERYQGEFQRTIQLPRKIESDSSITATYFEGVLTVRIPSKSAERRTIRIN